MAKINNYCWHSSRLKNSTSSLFCIIHLLQRIFLKKEPINHKPNKVIYIAMSSNPVFFLACSEKFKYIIHLVLQKQLHRTMPKVTFSIPNWPHKMSWNPMKHIAHSTRCRRNWLYYGMSTTTSFYLIIGCFWSSLRKMKCKLLVIVVIVVTLSNEWSHKLPFVSR